MRKAKRFECKVADKSDSARKGELMNLYRKPLFFPVCLGVVLVLTALNAHAQAIEGSAPTLLDQSETSEAKRNADEVEQLKARIAKLELLVEQQQRVLA